MFLQPDDKVSVDLWTGTTLSMPLARTAFVTAAGSVDRWIPDQEAWKRILRRDDVGVVPLAYNVTFVDLDGTASERAIRVDPPNASAKQVVPLGAKAGAPTSAATVAPPAVPTTPAMLLAAAVPAANPAFSLKMAGPASAKHPPLLASPESVPDANLLGFSNLERRSLNQTTVMVVRRIEDGRFHEYVLLRADSPLGQRDQESVKLVLSGVLLEPADGVSIDVLPRIPVVLTSIAAPQLFDFARQRVPCCPKLEPFQQAAQRAIQPICDRIADLGSMMGLEVIPDLPGTIGVPSPLP